MNGAMSFLKAYVVKTQLREFVKVCRVCQSRGSSGTVQRGRMAPPRCWSTSTVSLQLQRVNLSSQAQTMTTELGEDAATGMRSDSKPMGHPWRTVVGVCVQRFPMLSRAKTDLEQQFEELQMVIRAERSRLSDFELEEAEYLKKKKKRERMAMEEDLEESQVTKVEGIDEFEELLEARETELQSFKPASRETEADRRGDRRSLQRRLDQVLYLLVKKPRREHAWQMPQGGVEEEESLIEAATRELREECGSELQVKFLSGAPLAFLSYKYPHSEGHMGKIGSKVFFLKAQCRGSSAEVKLDQGELEDYVWVTREEMKDYVSQEYYRAVAPMLLD